MSEGRLLAMLQMVADGKGEKLPYLESQQLIHTGLCYEHWDAWVSNFTPPKFRLTDYGAQLLREANAAIVVAANFAPARTDKGNKT